MCFYHESPATLFPYLDTTQCNFTTHASPVSDPESPPTTQGHPPTRVSPVSVPESRLPVTILYLPLVPTTWLSLPVASYSFLPAKFLPRLPEVVYLLPPGATMPPFCKLPHRSQYFLRILQILAAMLTTAPPFTFFSLSRSSPTEFLLIPPLLSPRASPMSHHIAVVFASPRSFEENTCVFPLPSAPLLQKLPKSHIQKVVPLMPPPLECTLCGD